ncbi:MAG TPA: hypothetical protein VLJ60_10655 [bacterium]|nr:hypothetical protein [bacterium]
MKNRCSIIKMLITVVFFISSCATTGQQIRLERSKPSEPDWIKGVPAEENFFYVVGVSTKIDSLEKAKDIARKSAVSQLSEHIGIRMRSSVNIKSSSRSDTEVDENIDSTTQAEIRGMEIVDEYFVKKIREAGSLYEEKFSYYVLCRLNKKEADKERENQKQIGLSSANTSFKSFRKAKMLFKKGEELHAYNEMQNVVNTLKSLADNISLELNSEKIETTGELKVAAEDFFNRLQNFSNTININIKENNLYIDQFKSSIGSGLSKSGISISDNTEQCRFRLTIAISEKEGGEVFEKKAMYAIVSYNIKDLWAGKEFDSGNIEEKAFNKSAEDAFREAVRLSGERTGLNAGKKIKSYLNK